MYNSVGRAKSFLMTTTYKGVLVVSGTWYTPGTLLQYGTLGLIGPTSTVQRCSTW